MSKIRGVDRAEADPEFGSRPVRGEGEATGRDWPTSRLGRRSGATPWAGTDSAPTRAVLKGHHTVRPCSEAARLGQGLVAMHGRQYPRNTKRRPRFELPQVLARRDIQDDIHWATGMLKLKAESVSRYGAVAPPGPGSGHCEEPPTERYKR